MMRNYALSSLRNCFLHKKPVTCSRFFSTSGSPDPKTASHVPNTVDRYLLAWIKKYPSVKDVPDRVTRDEIERVRNWARIKINIASCVVAVFACIYMVKVGKDAAKRGESLQKMNLDWHKAQNEK